MIWQARRIRSARFHVRQLREAERHLEVAAAGVAHEQRLASARLGAVEKVAHVGDPVQVVNALEPPLHTHRERTLADKFDSVAREVPRIRH